MGRGPQACFAQFQPSQLSVFRTCWVYYPEKLQEILVGTVGLVDDLRFAVAIALAQNSVRAIGFPHPFEFTHDEVSGLFPRDALKLANASVLGGFSRHSDPQSTLFKGKAILLGE